MHDFYQRGFLRNEIAIRAQPNQQLVLAWFLQKQDPFVVHKERVHIRVQLKG